MAEQMLIVVMAFDLDDTGEMHTVFGPQDYQVEERAVREAKTLSTKHAGVIAWSREANVDIGEYGEPSTLFQSGDMADCSEMRGMQLCVWHR